jgi:hypothetical protein
MNPRSLLRHSRLYTSLEVASLPLSFPGFLAISMLVCVYCGSHDHPEFLHGFQQSAVQERADYDDCIAMLLTNTEAGEPGCGLMGSTCLCPVTNTLIIAEAGSRIRRNEWQDSHHWHVDQV